MNELEDDDGVRKIHKDDLRTLLCDAADEGASRVLDRLGLGDGHAADDIRVMRDIARGVREARREVWRTIGKGLVWLTIGGAAFWLGQRLGTR